MLEKVVFARDVIILDSIASLATKAELTGVVGDPPVVAAGPGLERIGQDSEDLVTRV